MPCEVCHKPEDVCVCARAVPLTTRTRVLILQHPQEQDLILGSVPLLVASLPLAKRVVGLSWRSLDAALGEEVDPKRWAVLYPASLKRELTEDERAKPFVVLDAKGEPRSKAGIEGIVLLDGTWSQAKTLWWRNAWLLKLARLLVFPRQPSIYGRLRKEPKRGYVSTLEAAALALEALGEPAEVSAALLKLFRTMVQRARDAGAVPAPRR